jgi:murein DD-endopeptidase MepM/ murein hydrolase activator NlpD
MNISCARIALSFVSVLGPIFAVLTPSEARAQAFTYDPPGTLVPTTSGKGRVDNKVYVPGMRFPMEAPNAYANSQVYGRGGGSGPGGGQCDKQNYSYPWHDNYCESRSWDMPLCPSGKGHQGQDIRPATCEKDKHWVVAGASGRITQVGNYSVYLTTSNGTRLDYLHMSNVQVAVGDTVTRGARLGKVSNVFGGTPTTYHLHFNIRQTLATVGAVYVPTYMSLIDSYQRLLNPSAVVDAGVESDAAVVIPVPDAGVDPEDKEPPPAKEDAIPEPPPPPNDEGCGCGQSPRAAGALLPGLIALGFVLNRRRRRRNG